VTPPDTARALEPAWRRLVAGRVLVAAACAVSGLLYVAFSQEIRHELADPTYKNTLITQFFREHGSGAVRLLRPVSPGGLVLLVLLVAAAIAAAQFIRRARGENRGRVELTAFAVAAVSVAAMVIATLLWPDGGGRLGSIEWLTVLGLIAITAGAVAWRIDWSEDLPPFPSTYRNDESHDPGRGWAIAFLVVLVPLVLATWWNGIDAIRRFDSLSDHLPRAARWYRLSRLSTESGELLTPYYPGNFQLIVRWFVGLGTDAYAFLPALLASVLCLVALYGICREIGQPKWTAVVVAATAASCSQLPYLSTTVEADTAMTAWLLLATLFLLRWLRTMRPPDGDGTEPGYNAASLVALGVCLGLAVGTKYSALPTVAVLCAFVAFNAWRVSGGTLPDGERYFNARTLVVMLAEVAVPALLCTGYWLLRNAIEHHNPFYPIKVGGMPGVDLRYIIPIKPSLVDSPLKRLTYPWVQWDFVTDYDDGLGAAYAAVGVVCFVAVLFRHRVSGSHRWLLWSITAAAFVLWIGTGSITARFGLFPVLLTFVFVGEAWREYESRALKAVTFASFALTAGVITYSMIVGAVYTTVMPPGKHGIPAIVDSLPPSRIFNATTAANRYPLLGADYRHEVVTMFRPARPADVAAAHPALVLLDNKQVPAFTAATPMTLIQRGPALPGGDTLSLWRVAR
jgi:hypothetical protein